MEKHINTIDDCRREIEIFVPNEELQPHYDAAYKKWQPEIQLQGFRKGKAPLNLVKKLFGERIEAESNQEILDKILQDIFKEDKLKIVGQPVITEINREEGGLRAKLEYEIIPEFELGEYKGLTLDEPVHRVTDDEVQKSIDKICMSNGDFVDTDQILDEQHVVGISLQETDKASGLPLIGGKTDEINVYLADQTVIPELRRMLLNTKTGDSFNFNPHSHDQHAPNKLFKVTVNDIQKLVAKELTDEFVTEYTKGKFTLVDDFKQEVSFQLQEEWDERTRQALERQVVNKLVEMHPVNLPESIVKSAAEYYFNGIKEKYKNTEYGKSLKFENMYDDLRVLATNNLRWEIIRNKIIEHEKITIEDFDVDPIIEAEAQHTNSDAGALKTNLMKNPEFVEQILAKKVMDFILDFAITNEVEFEEQDHDHDHHDHDHDHHDHDHDHDHDHEHHDHDHKH